MGPQPGTRGLCFSSYLLTLWELMCRNREAPKAGNLEAWVLDLGFRPVWGPTTLYHLDLREVPVS